MIEGEAPAAARKPVILFIDDDLGAARFAALPDALQAALGDITSPDLEGLWSIGRQKLGLPELNALTPRQALERIQQPEFIEQVVLSEEGKRQVGNELREAIASFDIRRESIAAFSGLVRAAFPPAEFDLREFPERPEVHERLLDADLLILDLVMGKGEPISKVKEFLRSLAVMAGERPIPPIVLVSSQDDLLKRSHLEIRASAHISAGGLFVLPKSDAAGAGAGHFVLTALFAQLKERKMAAARMRALCLAVEAAFRSVLDNTMRTLWSLDVASMHQIYLTARTENDSYNDHVLELLGREALWHLESDGNVGLALSNLGGEFAASIQEGENKPVIKFRYPSFVGIDTEALQSLMNHHACTPLVPARQVVDFNAERDPVGVPLVLPFGAVISTATFADKKNVLINITPQCNLLKRKLIGEGLSLSFVRATALPPLGRSSGALAREVVIDGRYYDLQILQGQTLSETAQRILEIARAENWRVQCRLRPDITRLIQQNVASYQTRTDLLSATRAASDSSRVCLKIGQRTTWYSDGAFADGKSVLAITTGSGKQHILDQEAFAVATWVAGQLAVQLNNDFYRASAFVLTLCEALQMGFGGTQNIGEMQVRAETCPLDAMEPKVGNQGVPGKMKALLWILSIGS